MQNFQFESPKMKPRESVRVPTVSDRAKFAVQISKDEAPTVRLLFIFARPPRNFENSQCLSNFAELRTNDIAGSSKQ